MAAMEDKLFSSLSAVPSLSFHYKNPIYLRESDSIWIPFNKVPSNVKISSLVEKKFLVEKSKSNQSRCRLCGEKIPKGEWRIGYPAKYSSGEFGVISSYVHGPNCSRLVFNICEAKDLSKECGFYDTLDEEGKKLFEDELRESHNIKTTADTDEASKEGEYIPEKIIRRESPPETLLVPLLPFQEEGLAWLIDQENGPYKGGVLADEMGMGKTIQAIALMLKNKLDKPTLIVSTLATVLQWKAEIEKFTVEGALRVAVYHGPLRGAMSRELNHFDVIITTYATVESDYRRIVTSYKLQCEYCSRKFLPNKLKIHLKYFCGPNAKRTEKQAMTDRGITKAMDTLHIGKGSSSFTPTPTNMYKELIMKSSNVKGEKKEILEEEFEKEEEADPEKEEKINAIKEKYSKLKVAEIKEHLDKLSLAVSGTKAVLLDRLAEFFYRQEESEVPPVKNDDDGALVKKNVVEKKKSAAGKVKTEKTSSRKSAKQQKTVEEEMEGTTENASKKAKVEENGTVISKAGAKKRASKKNNSVVAVPVKEEIPANGKRSRAALDASEAREKSSENITTSSGDSPQSAEATTVDSSPLANGSSHTEASSTVAAVKTEVPTSSNETREEDSPAVESNDEKEESEHDDDSDEIAIRRRPVRASRAKAAQRRMSITKDSDDSVSIISEDSSPKSKPRVSRAKAKSNRRIKREVDSGSDSSLFSVSSAEAASEGESDSIISLSDEEESEEERSTRNAVAKRAPSRNTSFIADEDEDEEDRKIVVKKQPRNKKSFVVDEEEDLGSDIGSYDDASDNSDMDADDEKLSYLMMGMNEESIDLSKSPIHNRTWGRIILDEAHKIKGKTTNTAKAVHRLKSEVSRFCLSGTPLQNRIGELYSLLRFIKLYPYSYYVCSKKGCSCSSLDFCFTSKGYCLLCNHTRMTHYSHFNRFISNPIKSYGNVGEGQKAMMLLKKDVLNNILLRRTKMERKEDLKLPPLEIVIRKDDLSADEKNFYQSLYMKTQSQFSSFVERGVILHNFAHIFDLLSKLRQAVNHPYLILYGKMFDDRMQSKTLQELKEIPFYKTCDLCLDEMNAENDDAITAKCNHSFHKACLSQYIQELDDNANLQCPSCYAVMNIDLSGITPVSSTHSPEPKKKPTKAKNKKSDDNDDEEPELDEKKAKALEKEIDLEVKKELNSLNPQTQDDNSVKKYRKQDFMSKFDKTNFQTSTKLEALIEEIENMLTEDITAKGIVFSQYSNMLALCEYRIKKTGLKCAIINGSLSMHARNHILHQFMTDKEFKIILISLKAGGEGLNLQVASRVFLIDPWWNPAAELQAIQRAHRIGQRKHVKAIRFISQDTIEERMLQLQEKKQLVFDGTVGNSDASIAKLSPEDLKFLFQN